MKRSTKSLKASKRASVITRVERLSPQSGDVIVFRCKDAKASTLSLAGTEAVRLGNYLRKTGRNCIIILLDDDIEISQISPEVMKQMGFIRLDS